MIKCDVCEKGFKYNYLLLKHLERKIPCQRPRNKNCNRSYEGESKVSEKYHSCIDSTSNCKDGISKSKYSVPISSGCTRKHKANFKCEYCHVLLYRPCKLKSHMEICKMKDDEVRKLEMELNKEVILDPRSNMCRFCNKEYLNVRNLHRHDKICKAKEEYKEELLKELNTHKQPSATTTNNNNITINIDNHIDNSHNINNNSMNIMNYDHDYEHITIDNIIKCLKISKEKREDAIASLGRFIRESDKNDRSVIVSNLRCKNVKAYEDGQYVTKDARTVIANRGQEAAYRLDSAKEEVSEEHHPLWHKKDFGDIEATLSMATYSTTDKDANKIYEAVKMAIYDANKLLRNT